MGKHLYWLSDAEWVKIEPYRANRCAAEMPDGCVLRQVQASERKLSSNCRRRSSASCSSTAGDGCLPALRG